MNPPEELAYTAYVIDAERHLLGILTLRDLILASPEEQVGDIMSRDFVLFSLMMIRKRRLKSFQKI